MIPTTFWIVILSSASNRVVPMECPPAGKVKTSKHLMQKLAGYA